MALRLLLVAVLVLAGGGLTLAYRRRRALDDRRGAVDPATGDRWPDLPAELLATELVAAEPAAPAPAPPVTSGVAPGAGRTWVIFTTPLCVSCEAVRRDLVAHEPTSRVLTVDATVRPDLAERYGIQRAPTTVLADERGRIQARLVGPEGVRAHLRGVLDGATLPA